jgi:hypothetical protein
MRFMGPFGWSLLAALVLASCITDGDRGHAFNLTDTFEPQGIDPWRVAGAQVPARGGTRAERDETATLVALTASIVETQRAAAQLALERLSAEPLREHAAEAAAAAEDNLAALHTLTLARGLVVAPSTLSDDPLFVAQREVAEHELSRLRTLSGATFARTWLAGERQRLELLASLAVLGLRLSPDVAAGNAFRMIAQDARTQAERGVTVGRTVADG